jgi:hypothetical protein
MPANLNPPRHQNLSSPGWSASSEGYGASQVQEPPDSLGCTSAGQRARAGTLAGGLLLVAAQVTELRRSWCMAAVLRV